MIGRRPVGASVTLCPITSDCVDAPLFRMTLPPGARTGLKDVSQVMIDKVISVPRVSISAEVGECNTEEMEAVDRGLRRWLALD